MNGSDVMDYGELPQLEVDDNDDEEYDSNAWGRIYLRGGCLQ